MESKTSEETKKSYSKPDADLQKLKEAASKPSKSAFTTKRPWRAIFPWWFSVTKIKRVGSEVQTYMGGKCYTPDGAHKETKAEREAREKKFVDDFRDIVWVSYRSGFSGFSKCPKIPVHYRSTKSDAGWGCMIRAAQMLLANCLLRHSFPDLDYSLKRAAENTEVRLKYLSVIKQFMDNLAGKSAAFSIGNIVELGLEYDRKPGDWYGPSTMIQIFAQLNEMHKPFADLGIVSFPEGIIYDNKVQQKGRREGGKWTPVIVLLGFRLGLDKINKDYYPEILRLMRLPQFVGVSGGQGDGALYFVGYQNNQLIFIDPHVTQSAVEKVEDLWKDHMSYHCSTPLRLPLSQLNTSLAYGFYLRTEKDYESFVAEMKKEMKGPNSFIQIYDKEIAYDLPAASHEDVVCIGDTGKKEVFIIY